MDLSRLQAGDCLLYTPSGVFGSLIKLKTWHAISHVEVYGGDGSSWASRDGLGVGRYPLRTDHLAGAWRPLHPLNLPAAVAYSVRMRGTPYGWPELFTFIGITVRGRGVFCSEFATEWYRAAGMDPFPGEDPQFVAPFEFAINPDFQRVW